MLSLEAEGNFSINLKQVNQYLYLRLKVLKRTLKSEVLCVDLIE